MVRADIDIMLKEVIKQAQDIKIPVSLNIHKNVYINPRPKKRYGCCKSVGGKYEIELSEFLLRAEEIKIKEVLAHEVLHTCKGCADHGKTWRTYAEMMNRAYGYNIKRASSNESLGIKSEPQTVTYRYVIKCEKCGREYPRQRFTCVMKKINAYRCQCGGKLTLINIQGKASPR